MAQTAQKKPKFLKMQKGRTVNIAEEAKKCHIDQNIKNDHNDPNVQNNQPGRLGKRAKLNKKPKLPETRELQEKLT